MKFKPIPFFYFERFHNKFKGDNIEIFEVCRACGGACEYNKIATLLPGEKEYMTKKLGISAKTFEYEYLDVIKMEDGTKFNVLKLTYGCPFLNKLTHECECKQFKVVLCEIYPIVFRVTERNIDYSIDDWCPLSCIRKFRKYFEEIGIPAFTEIPVPKKWLEMVFRYDPLNLDYKAIQKKRKNFHRCEIWPFELLLKYTQEDTNRELWRQ